ncbi:hypothetical protein [Streptomyces sp. WAC 04229]
MEPPRASRVGAGEPTAGVDAADVSAGPRVRGQIRTAARGPARAH